jgi:hypothetical protein
LRIAQISTFCGGRDGDYADRVFAFANSVLSFLPIRGNTKTKNKKMRLLSVRRSGWGAKTLSTFSPTLFLLVSWAALWHPEVLAGFDPSGSRLF